MGFGDRVHRAESEVGGSDWRAWLKGWGGNPDPITDPYKYNNDIIRDAENYMAREVGGPDLRRFRMGGGLETWEPRGGIPWENLPPVSSSPSFSPRRDLDIAPRGLQLTPRFAPNWTPGEEWNPRPFNTEIRRESTPDWGFLDWILNLLPQRREREYPTYPMT